MSVGRDKIRAMSILAAFSRRTPAVDLGHRFALVDVETTGLNSYSDRVVQVAVRQLDQHGALERSWHTLVDPQRDPGPTHIHGITPQMLVGAPTFPAVAGKVAELVDGRVLVAHNAAFDWGFLHAESTRAARPLSSPHRLCTLGLARRLDLDLPNLKLGTLADWASVTQQHAHSADDDVLVLQSVFLKLAGQARQAGVPLPLSRNTAPAPQHLRVARAPGVESPWETPGPWRLGRPLVQGMRFAISGGTRAQRSELYQQAITAGLVPMNSISTRSHFLVCTDPAMSTGKATGARRMDIPVITEDQFLSLLTGVRPGVLPTAAPPRPKAARTPAGPLGGFRVLVLGGPHDRAAEVRDRAAAGGARLAVNLTPTVTHLIALGGAQDDPRWVRAGHLTQLDPVDLSVVEPALALPSGQFPYGSMESILAITATPAAGVQDRLLRRGEVIDLDPWISRWDLFISWTLTDPPMELDVVAFVVDADHHVLSDEHFVFFNALESPGGEVTIELDPSETRVSVNLDELAVPGVRVIVGASLAGGHTFGDLGPVELTLRDPDGAPFARSVLDAGTVETSLLLAEFYQRDNAWRIRAVGQGHEELLEQFAIRHGVNVD